MADWPLVQGGARNYLDDTLIPVFRIKTGISSRKLNMWKIKGYICINIFNGNAIAYILSFLVAPTNKIKRIKYNSPIGRKYI